MANIRPFNALRPKMGLEKQIAALPYDVFSEAEARKEVEEKPVSFLRIDRAETNFPESVSTYDDCVYAKASELLWDMVSKGQFVQEENPYYYLYELTMNGRSQTGIVACVSVDDYLNNVIRKHENTRVDKEEDRIRHVDTCNAQTGPIFLAYRTNKTLNELITASKKETPIYNFQTDDEVIHRVWVVNDEDKILQIERTFAGICNIYIADGHHRCASAAKVSLMRRKEHSDYSGTEEFNYFLSVLFADEELMIMDYNRVLKDMNHYSKEGLLRELSKVFEIELKGKIQVRPSKKGEFGMYVSEEWYQLNLQDSYKSDDPVDGLDVSVLQNHVLNPIFGIEDPKTDNRIDFVGGIRGLDELEKRVHNDCMVAFSMYPTSISELFEVADVNRLMPPKSTWFEPKLRSGLFVHSIKE